MPAKTCTEEITAAEREGRMARLSKGKVPATTILKSRIQMKADQAERNPGWLDAAIVEALDADLTMVERVWAKLVTAGPDAVMTRKNRGGHRRSGHRRSFRPSRVEGLGRGPRLRPRAPA